MQASKTMLDLLKSSRDLLPKGKPREEIDGKIAVAEGDEVQEGQALATVEAMKMENILKAERKGVVKAIKASAGASLKVDDVIMEFE